MKAKSFIREYWAALIVFALCAAVLLLFCGRKTGLFIDEVYTYGLSNSYYAPYISEAGDGEFDGRIYTSADVLEYLTAGGESRFAFGSVYYNQARDVHPPLYYWLFNCVSSLMPGTFSVKAGVALNALLFLVCLFIFWKLAMLLFGSRDTAAAGTALFGMSTLAMSMVMMIRMYTLLTVFTLLTAHLTARIMREPERKGLYPLLMLSIFLGMMTQYYFAFYAFFLCAAYCVYALCKKRYRSFWIFAACALAGAALTAAVFPACLRQLFVGNGQVVGGSSVTEELKDVSRYGESIRQMWKASLRTRGINITMIASAVLALALLPCAVKKRRGDAVLSAGSGAADTADEISSCGKSGQEAALFPCSSLLIILPAVPAFLLAAVISPVKELRYIYNLTPFAALGVCFFINTAEREFTVLTGHGRTGSGACDAGASGNADRAKYIFGKALVLACAAAALLTAKTMPPDNLFTEHAEYDRMCAEHASSPCVYVTDGKFASVTQDLPELMRFESFLVTSDPASEKTLSYVGDADEAVIYIDTNRFWSSGYDADEVKAEFAAATGLEESGLLYSYTYEGVDGLSSAYVMKRP